MCVHAHKDSHMSSWSTVKKHALSFAVFLILKSERDKVALLSCGETSSNISFQMKCLFNRTIYVTGATVCTTRQ